MISRTTRIICDWCGKEEFFNSKDFLKCESTLLDFNIGWVIKKGSHVIFNKHYCSKACQENHAKQP